MVSRTLRYKVIFLGLVAVVFLIVFGMRATSVFSRQVVSPIYSASDHALDLAVLDGVVKASNNQKSSHMGTIKAVIVPHHLVAAESIALGIQSLASSSPEVIILISPDHFARCPTLLCTTKGKYTTFFGDVVIEEKSVVSLLHASDIIQESSLFDKEHGIYTILPFVKRYVPQATIVPIVVSQKGRGTEESRNEMIRILEPLLARNDVALVISSDFSHYLPLEESNAMDVKTQNSVCSGNASELLTLNNPKQSDCPLCLWFAEQEAKHLGYWNPRLVIHTNSATLLNDLTVKETTSHFTFTFSSTSTGATCPLIPSTSSQPQLNEATITLTSSSSQATIVAVGDMMFDRYIRQVANKKGEEFLFSCVDPLLEKADLVLGNLEGPITPLPSTSMGTVIGSKENYYFTFPTSTAQLLAKHHITLVNIGNNHIANQKEEGIISTKKYLSQAGVAYFGGLSSDNPLYRMEKNGERLSFISYNQFGGVSKEKIAQIIQEEHVGGRTVIVYTHWGEEYRGPTEGVRSTAALFAQSGADLIIGSHPHVISSHEMIGNTLVYYSLGNFIFDQYFDNTVMEGLTLIVTIANGKVTVKEQKVSLGKDGRTCPVRR